MQQPSARCSSARTLDAAECLNHSQMPSAVGQCTYHDVTHAGLPTIKVNAAFFELVVVDRSYHLLGRGKNAARVVADYIFAGQWKGSRNIIVHPHAGLSKAQSF